MKNTLATFAALTALLTTHQAFACAVCFNATEDTRDAFLGTTVFLSLIPLALIGGTIYWLWRTTNAAQAAVEQETALVEEAPVVFDNRRPAA